MYFSQPHSSIRFRGQMHPCISDGSTVYHYVLPHKTAYAKLRQPTTNSANSTLPQGTFGLFVVALINTHFSHSAISGLLNYALSNAHPHTIRHTRKQSQSSCMPIKLQMHKIERAEAHRRRSEYNPRLRYAYKLFNKRKSKESGPATNDEKRS
jgi:hypothetical protein